MIVYQFDAEIAAAYGVDEAVMIWNLQYWIEHNRANGMHFHDGRYWTWNSVDAFTQIFPFWSRSQVRRILKSLEDKEVIMTGNYNQSAYDRKTWYAFTDRFSQIHLLKSTNGDVETEKSITDSTIATDSNKIIKQDDKEREADGGLFPLSPSEVKTKKSRGTTEPLCLFVNSRYYDFDLFAEQFRGDPFRGVDIRYYYGVVADWSSSKGAKKQDWIATARNIMRRDSDDGKLHRCVVPGCALSPDAIKYLENMAD